MTVMMVKSMLALTEDCPLRVPVLWVFQDYDGHWRFRKEGDASDVAYASRRDAVAAARFFGERRGAYRLYLQLTHGRFAMELLNTGANKRRASSTVFEDGQRNGTRQTRRT